MLDITMDLVLATTLDTNKGNEMNTETKQPKRMGRPLKPGGALSNKERQQRWRDRVKTDADKLLAQLKDLV